MIKPLTCTGLGWHCILLGDVMCHTGPFVPIIKWEHSYERLQCGCWKNVMTLKWLSHQGHLHVANQQQKNQD